MKIQVKKQAKKNVLWFILIAAFVLGSTVLLGLSMSASKKTMNNEVVVNTISDPDSDGGLAVETQDAPLMPIDRESQDSYVFGYGFIELDLPGEPVQVLPYTGFYGDDMSSMWSGWEGMLGVYRYTDSLLDFDVWIYVAYVTDETVSTYIEPRIREGNYTDYTDEAGRSMLEAEAGHFLGYAHFLGYGKEALGSDLDLIGLAGAPHIKHTELQNEVVEEGAHVINKSTPSGMEEETVWYTYYTDGSAMVSLPLWENTMFVKVYVMSNDQRGYDAGIEIFGTIRPMQQREIEVLYTIDDLRNIDYASLLLDDGRLYLPKDPDSFMWLEQNFSTAEGMDITPECPVGRATLSIATGNAREFTIYPALDDCRMFMFDGKYYSWGSGSNEAFFALFGATDFDSLLELPHDDIVIRAE